MRTRLAAFTATLVVLLGGGVAVGKLINPSPPRAASNEEMTDMATMVRGLAVADNDLRLVVATPDFTRGESQQLRFRIVDAKNQTVRDFDVEQTKRMHLVVVRRDLTGFQHLHPVQAGDGTWSVPLRLERPGSYRVFADFSHDDEPTTLASDVRVDGKGMLAPIPAPASEARTGDGYTVRIGADQARAGTETAM